MLTLLAGVLLAGVLSGLAGAGLTLLLDVVQHIAMGYQTGTFAEAVLRASPVRRVVAITIGSLVAGLGWWWVRSRRRVPSLAAVVRGPVDGRRLGAVLADALLQVAFVGSGGSVGREGAPRQLAAGSTAWALGGLRLGAGDTRILVA